MSGGFVSSESGEGSGFLVQRSGLSPAGSQRREGPQHWTGPPVSVGCQDSGVPESQSPGGITNHPRSSSND